MSVAHKLSYSRSIDGSTAHALPSKERAVGPHSKPVVRRINRKLLAVCGFTWVLVMAFSLLLVHMNGQIAAETKAITRAREELNLLQRKNMELEARRVEASSVAAVERWALAKGMKRPTSVKTLKGDPSAVAVHPVPQSAPAETERIVNLWGTVKAYIARMSSTLNLVGSPK